MARRQERENSSTSVETTGHLSVRALSLDPAARAVDSCCGGANFRGTPIELVTGSTEAAAAKERDEDPGAGAGFEPVTSGRSGSGTTELSFGHG